MMKTVFFSAVVLSLLAVGWSAPLVCEKLSKPVEKEVDLKGTWYVIAMSTESCWQALLLNLFLWPSASMDITSKGTVNTYNANLKMKMYGYCMNETELFSSKASLDGTDPNEVYLHTGCPDCVVIKERRSIMFMSRRTIVTAAEMTEFEKQAECLGWPKVQVLNTDHGTENCKDYTQAQELSEKEMEEIAESFGKRLSDMFLDLLKCFFRILGLTCIA